MKIDSTSVPINTLETMSKKVLVWSCAADKGKVKNIIIGDPRMPNLSRRVVNRKTLDKRKTGGVGGQARSDTRSRSSALRTPDGPGTKSRQSRTSAYSPTMKIGRSADNQKQQRP
jgi:hypothetical protein